MSKITEETNLHRMEFIVQDHLVGQIQRYLMTLRGVYDYKSTPIANAVIRPNGKIGNVNKGNNLFTQFAQVLIKDKIQTVTPAQMQNWLKSQGKSPLSSNYVLKHLVQAGILARHSSLKNTYIVVAHAPKALPAPKKGKSNG